MSSSVECRGCGHPFTGPEGTERAPCPRCGSTRRTFHEAITEAVTVYDSLGVKVKDPTKTGKSKVRVEDFGGHERSRDGGRLVRKHRLIDRENDLYVEVVSDPATGEVLHECRERLSEHRGHGSARQRVTEAPALDLPKSGKPLGQGNP